MSVPALIEAVCPRNAYGARLAIEDLTFSVNAGQIVGLLGPNGVGKTTTLSILATFIAPDASEVRIAGIDSRAWLPIVCGESSASFRSLSRSTHR
jgi:ABC-2 type transport system ATP-binding protein